MTKNPEKPFQCAACPNKAFSTAGGLKAHASSKQHWPCRECKQYFPTPEAFQQHKDTKHAQVTQVPNRLEKVNNNQHPTGLPWYCPQCVRWFATQEALEQHKSDVKCYERKWSCQKCAKWFVTQAALEQHKKDTKDHWDWICQKCNKAFGTREALEQHKNSNGHNDGDLPQVHEVASSQSRPEQKQTLPSQQVVSNPSRPEHKPVLPSQQVVSNLPRPEQKHVFPSQQDAKPLAIQEAHEQHQESKDHHNDNTNQPQVWTCQQCNLTFDTREAFEKHRRDFTDHNDGNRPQAAEVALDQSLPERKQPCCPCHLLLSDGAFGTVPETLGLNQESKGNNNINYYYGVYRPQTWQCQPCDRTFISREALEQHLRDSRKHMPRRPPPDWPRPTAYLVGYPVVQDGADASPTMANTPVLLPLVPVPHHQQQQQQQQSFPSLQLATPPPPSPPQNNNNNNPAKHAARLTAVMQGLPPPPPLVHRGITYTTLTFPEQMTLLSLLLSSCHSPARLASETVPARRKRLAVVLDCEMAGTDRGDQVIALSLVDFFTGATLVHSLVQPSPGVRVRDWRTHITGISAGVMSAAAAQGRVLHGRDEALARLLDFVDADTIVVGHAVKHDLRVLGLAHNRVVDSAILAAEASGMFGTDRSMPGIALERLCRELVGVQIRRGGPAVAAAGPSKQTHDSLEDVLATRELVIWCLTHPAELQAWAAKHWKPWVEVKSNNNNNNKAWAWESKGDSDRMTISPPESSDELSWEEVEPLFDSSSDSLDYDTPPEWSD
ncbi:hypothetical protein VTH82DRAFT_3921 [Thermothelomyces myriococcoides]